MERTTKQQASMDKGEILEAIYSRMGKLGEDHDTLIRVEELLKTSIEDRERLNKALFGEDGTDGIVSWLHTIKTQMIYVFIVGSGIIGVLTWLVLLHVRL